MTADWNVVNRLLDQALDLPQAERTAFLDRELALDPGLRQELKELIEACEEEHGFLETPAAAFAASLLELDDNDESDAPLPANRIGPFRLIREIGRGGMGRVFLAERSDGQFEQRVALKLIKRGMDSDEISRRFLAERQILARLEHPNIARLLDGGVTDDGQPWFAMEYVDGLPITRHSRTRELSIADRLALFEYVCDAVRYAHQNLVVHRDLKPSNILVTADGTVKLLDFGIAKLLTETPGDQSQVGTAIPAMTPEYAAPEQVRQEAVTTATDVYALGAVLYEVLTGRRVQQISKHTPLEIARVVCETEPAPPRVNSDLDTILLKALQKEPARRYPTADALLDDLRRHRTGLPVRARPDTFSYRARKFVRRNRLGVIAASAVLITLVAGIAAATWQAQTARRQAARAEEVKKFVISLFQVTDPAQSRGRELTARDMLDLGAKRLDSALERQPEIQAELLAALGGIYHSLGHYPQADSLYSRSVTIARAVHGESDTTFARILTEWAETLQLMSRWAPADSAVTTALAVQRRKLGKTDPELARTLVVLGNLERLQGDFPSAERHYLEGLAIRRSLGPTYRFHESMTMRALSLVYWEEGGRLEEAFKTASDALALQQKILHPEHQEITRTLRNLAGISRDRGKLEEAEKLGRQFLARANRLYPNGHPDVGTALDELAGTLDMRGSYAEAESLYVQAVAVRTKWVGKDRPETLNSLMGAGFIRYRIGDLEGAERATTEAYEGYRRVLGDDHRLTLWGLNTIGLIRREQKRYEEAEEILRRALAGRRRQVPNHPSVGISLKHLGVLLQRTGRSAEAELRLREALEIYRVSLPAKHTLRVELLSDLASVLITNDKAPEAEKLLRESLAIGVDLLPANDLRLVETRRVLGVALAKLGRDAEAEPMLRASYEDAKANAYGERVRSAALRSLVDYYESRKRSREAAEYRRLLTAVRS